MTSWWTPLVIAQVTGPELVPPVWRTMLGLVVVLGLLLALAWLLRRGVVAKRSSGTLTVETALPLGDRRSLVIVAVEGRRLLLGLSSSQVSLVAELRAAATSASPTPTFAEAMARAANVPESRR